MHILTKLLLKNSHRGFTLLELMIVIVMLGVLAAISIPQLLGMVAKARETEIHNQIASLVRAENVYYLEHGKFAKINSTQMRNHEHGLDVAITNDKYNIRTTFASEYNAVRVKATALGEYQTSLKNYTAGLHYSGGIFASIICQTHDPGGDIVYIAQFTLSGDQPHAKCDLSKSRQIQ
ncbi:MAG: type IV pilin-like G/H family protein [Crocosphaera sp.]|nr:type IV pilin-like G/H family protein [Crocosphaera sp.]